MCKINMQLRYASIIQWFQIVVGYFGTKIFSAKMVQITLTHFLSDGDFSDNFLLGFDEHVNQGAN